MIHTVNTVTPLPVDCTVREIVIADPHAGHHIIDTSTFEHPDQAYCVDCNVPYARSVERVMEEAWQTAQE